MSAHADLEASLGSGDLAAAEAELEGLAADWEAAHAADPTEENREQWAVTLSALGTIERALGLPDEARAHLEKGIGLAVQPATKANLKETLALTLADLGDPAKAESLLRELLAFHAELPEPGRSEGVARIQEQLGLILLTLGRYEESGELLEFAFKATPENDNANLARRHARLGRYHHTLGSHQRAIDHFSAALEIVPEADGEFRIALTSDLALARLRLGEIDLAGQGFAQAADQARRLYRDKRPTFAIPYINNLGTFAMSAGQPEEAIAAFTECIEMLEAASGTDDASLIGPVHNLGVARLETGDYPEARRLLERATALQTAHLPPGHLRVAETARNLARCALLNADPDAPELIDRASALGLDLLERLVAHGTETERLNFLQRIDLLSLPCAGGDPAIIAPLLAASKNRLFDSLLGEKDTAPGPDAAEIGNALPPGSVFVDFCRYAETTADPVLRYGAIVYAPDLPPAWTPLGTEEELADWLSALRSRLDWKADTLSGNDRPPPPLQLRGILRELHRSFIEPLGLPDSCSTVIVSPDASLHFLPFAALIDSESELMCERFDLLVSIGSARDFLGTAPTRRLDSAPWRLAGVTRFEPRETSGSTKLDEILDHLDPLPGTRDELRRIGRLAPEGSVTLTDDAVAEPNLITKEMPAAVLHLGTHSFFLDGPHDPLSPIDFDRSADLLFSSGIVLPRAARRSPDAPLLDPADDLLFPREIAALPLHGTRLVVLSSCRSGAGTALAGEGVLGLQRAFQLAGAREVLVALWPVSDRASPAFMESFYRLSKHSDHPAQALWETQRRFLTQPVDDFETAVLHAAPFVIVQNGPPLPLAELPPETTSRFPWKALLASLPLALFVAAWLRRRSAAHAEKRLAG
ncbi:filamentous hemagglutinin family domain-containing protein [Haloferula helveola]|uniref:Filamentous hemagglutinin family domain-containing protein n=1 Tax=Haloferula helveola TaxID=490095 RepID=A0ABN6GZ46_9BACT|nr:filamentous hemagglutinin family domain-containing protein [Haloferula helveola]